MRRAAVQMGFCSDLADAQFLMFEAETVREFAPPDRSRECGNDSMKTLESVLPLLGYQKYFAPVSYTKTAFRDPSKGFSCCQ